MLIPASITTRLACCLILLAIMTMACGGGISAPFEAPEIDLDGVEPAIAVAVQAALDAVNGSPGDAAPWGSLAMTLDANGFDGEAVTAYRQASVLAPGEYRWPYLAGLQLEDSDEEAAQKEFARAVALAPDNPAVLLKSGELFLSTGEIAAATQAFERALDQDQRSPYAFFGLGRASLVADDHTTARRYLSRATELRPDYRQAHTALAEVLQLLGQGEAAQVARWTASNHRVLNIPDTDRDQVLGHGVGASFHKIRALNHARSGRLVEAEAEYRQAIEKDPRNASHHTNLGSFLARQARFDEAAEAFRTSMALRPADGTIRNNLGQVLLSLGEIELAREQFEAVVALGTDENDEAVRAHLNLASICEGEGLYEAGFDHTRQAVQSSPGNLHALRRFATSLLRARQVEQAADITERALRIDPYDHQTALQLAFIYSRLGRHGDSVSLLNNLTRQLPDDPRPTLLLAWELATAPDAADRDGDRALAMAVALRRAHPDLADAADVLAAALAETGDYAAAVQVMDEAVPLARATGQEQVVVDYRERRDLYRRGRPFRQER